MSAHLLIGKTQSGKTKEIYRQMLAKTEATKPVPQLLIVPEQATLKAQEALVASHPGHCISNMEVLSFQRLAYRVGDSLGIAGKTLINDVGKNILIRQIIDTDKEHYPFLNRYAHKKGYINELRTLLTEFSRYTLDDATFETLEHHVKPGVLKMKLTDLGHLYSQYKGHLEEGYISGETVMDRLLATCHNNAFIKSADIYIDGFYGFTPLQYQLIRKLSETAKSLTVSVTIDPAMLTEPVPEETHLYYEPRVTYDRLRAIFTENPSAVFDKVVFEKTYKNPVKKAIADNLYQYPYKPFEGKATEVKISKALSTQQEMAYVRDSILKLVRDGRYRFKDIGILTGDLGRHRQLIQEKFDEAGMPYYLDRKKAATANEGVAFVLALVRSYSRGLEYGTFFECLKSGWMGVEGDLLDYMENYVLRYGIRGFAKWGKPWVYKVPDYHGKAEEPLAVERLAAINALRERMITPLMAHRIKGRKPIRAYIEALYALLNHYDLEGQLQKKADGYEAAGDFVRSREYNQIYGVIIDLLDQLDSLGDMTKVTYSEFYDLMEAGFETIELGLVPANVDQIIIGDLTRSRMGSKKALFIIGVNEGVIPSLNEGAGLLTDDERRQLSDVGVQLAPTATTGLFRDQYYIYMALQRFKEKLYLSYTMTDDDGKVTRPSHLLNILGKILPGAAHYDIGTLYEQSRVPATAAVAYRKYLEDRQRGRAVEPAVERWLEHQPHWGSKLRAALMAESETFAPRKLNKRASKNLYGYRLSNSVSRLEQFSACPFAHFITYGLKASEREGFEITLPHMGMIFHQVIERFSKRLILREMPWEAVDDALRVRWIDELVADVLGDDSYSAFFDNNRNRYRIQRLKTMLDRALWGIGYQITQGDFRPREAEWRFDGNDHPLAAINLTLKEGQKMSLRGTIDRVDHHNIAGIAYITVVDYKSSAHDLDMNQLYAGLQLQLLVYLNAACEVKEASLGTVKPAGIFYFKIDDPFLSSGEKLSEEARDKGIQEKMRLKGLVVDDGAVITALDKSFHRKSRVIPVARNKDGSLAKASKVISEEDLDLIRAFTQRKVQAIGEDIVSGDIEAMPARDNKGSACDWCSYRSICQFDENLKGYHYRDIGDDASQDVIERIRKDMKEG